MRQLKVSGEPSHLGSAAQPDGRMALSVGEASMVTTNSATANAPSPCSPASSTRSSAARPPVQ